MKKVCIVGKNSFIASHLDYEIISERLPISADGIRAILEKYKPAVILNCVAFTGGKNIDGCEIDMAKTIEHNLIIPSMLAIECEHMGIHMVHIGSGCIFYGKSPNFEITNLKTTEKYFDAIPQYKDTGWKETDDPKLGNASTYSKIKYSSDLAIGSLKGTSILRIRMPISSKISSRNLINKLLNYTDIVETPNSVTFISDLIRVIDWTIQNEKFGIYHVTNKQPLTHSRILEEYQKYKPFSYNKITPEQLSLLTVANRSNCLIDSSKLENEGFKMTDTIEALEKTMKEYCNG